MRPTVSPAPVPGTSLLGRYVVERVIGEGATGRMLAVRHTGLGRSFAMKIVRGPSASNPTFQRRFVAEARGVAPLSQTCRYLATLHEAGSLSDDALYFVEDLLMGQDLGHTLLVQRSFPLGPALVIGLQILDALVLAHQAGVLHRDIRPANVFLLRGDVAQPDVRLLELGIARDTRARASSGRITGAPSYLAPEHLQGLPVDERTDVWAVGAVLYELLSGSVPFGGATLGETLQAVLLREPRPLPRHVPDGVADTIGRALVKNPAMRLPNASALAQSLLPHVPSYLARYLPSRWAGLAGSAAR